MEERLQKLMAQAGIGSRRDCEQLILAGRVMVNGETAQIGQKADPERDRILVDGSPLKAPEKLVYIAVYKPRGVLSAVSSEDRRPTVRDLVPEPGHLFPVGRLDFDSEGLILLTNDGNLTNRLTHPRYEHEKEYRVLVASRPDEEQLNTWRRGVVLEDGYRTQPADVRIEGVLGKGAWLRVILREGRKRQIRETGLRIGLPVVKILRVRIGTLTLGTLKPKEWRYLTPAEVDALKTAPGKPAPGANKGDTGGRPRFTPRGRTPDGRGRSAERPYKGRSSDGERRPDERRRTGSADRPYDERRPDERRRTGSADRPYDERRPDERRRTGSADRPYDERRPDERRRTGSADRPYDERRPDERRPRNANRDDRAERAPRGAGQGSRPPERSERPFERRSDSQRPEDGARRPSNPAGRKRSPMRRPRRSSPLKPPRRNR